MQIHPAIHTVTLGVADLDRSYKFYKEGLGFATPHTPDHGIVLFITRGARFYIYPYDKLAEDAGFSPPFVKPANVCLGFGLGQACGSKAEVDEMLRRAASAGGRITKPAALAFWGGYSGYIADPDDYRWEFAYADAFKFSAEGALVLDK